MVTVFLNMEGNEVTKTKAFKKNFYERKNLCKARIIRDVIMNTTNYILPFEFNLPHTLPTTIQCYDDNDSSKCCNISYQLSIDILVHFQVNMKNFAERKFNVVSPPLPNDSVPIFIAPKNYVVQSLGGMMKKGCFNIAARIPDVHISKGLHLKLYLACCNNAISSIYRIEIKLMEITSWSASKIIRLGENKCVRALVKILDIPNLPGVERRKKAGSTAIDGPQYNKLLGNLYSEENSIQVKIPYSCRNTYEGRLIKTFHNLEITFYTRKNTSNPLIQIRFELVPLQRSLMKHLSFLLYLLKP